ncbi:hypothetical protein [Alkalimarinus coralli]|uniref:hypothetical protein n=1 Tax=Alkalimarinus coralli TaxID=2935863 RepID=UPI00202B1AE4|nr:hypothetical protein [Alkalimarinus coralli]
MGELVTTKTINSRKYVEKNGISKWEYDVEYQYTNHPVALTLERDANGIVSGYMFHEKENCIFSVKNVALSNRRNSEINLKLVENSVLGECPHKHILPNVQLRLLDDNSLRVKGRYFQKSVDQQKSILSRQKSNVFARQLEAALELHGDRFDTTPVLQNVSGAYGGKSFDFRFLFPQGLATPNSLYIQSLNESSGCENAFYSQQSINGKIKIVAHDEGCTAFAYGYFAINTDDSLKVTWQPDKHVEKQAIPADQALILKRQLKITGNLAQLKDFYLNNSDRLSLSQAANEYLSDLKNNKRLLNTLFSNELNFNDYSYKFIGSWDGVIEVDGSVNQAALALWTGKHGDYSYMQGYLALSENCFYPVSLSDENGVALFNLKNGYENKCSSTHVSIRSRFHTPVYMDTEFKKLRFQFPLKFPPKGVRYKKSTVRAAFKRAKPTEYLLSIINGSNEHSMTPPDATTSMLMSSAEVPGSKIEEIHNGALKASSDLLEQRRIAGEKQRAAQNALALEKYEKNRQREIEVGLRKPDRPERQRYSSADVQPMPVVNGPFDGLPGATFLNAVYQGKPSLVRRINENYNLAQSAGLKRFFGSYGNQMTDAMANMHKNVRIQDSVAAKYLFEYERYSKQCLSSSPAIFYVIGYEPDMVFTNLLGVETARYYGSTSVNQYKVNQEFSGVFNRVGKMSPESMSAQLTGLFASQGNEDLRKSAMAGIGKMRNKFACDSDEIKRFERNLIALFK